MSSNELIVAESLRDELRGLRATIVAEVADQVRGLGQHVVLSNTAIETALDQALDKALAVDMTDVIFGGWRRWRDLNEKALASRGDDALHVIPLVEHSIDVAYEPTVELIVNGASIGKIVLRLEVSFNLSGFRVTLKHGAVTAVDAGECRSLGKVKLSGKQLWAGPLGRVKIPATWKVDPPLALDGARPGDR
jgi:hypothetical protein